MKALSKDGDSGIVDEANLGLGEVSSKASSKQSAVVKPFQTKNDTTNILGPTQATPALINKITYPDNFDRVQKIGYEMPTQDSMYKHELLKLSLLEKQLKEKRESFYGPPLDEPEESTIKGNNRVSVFPIRAPGQQIDDK